MRIVGIILVVVGLLMLVFRGLNFTEKKKVVDLGPVEINKEENKTVTWPLYAGGVAVIAGIAFVVAGRKK